MRGQHDMAGSLGSRSTGLAISASSPSSPQHLDGTATMQSVSNGLPQSAASTSPMQVPRFRIKPVLMESHSQVCPGLEVQVELPGISSCAAIHAYLIRDCFAVTAGTYHLQLHLDAPDICLRDLKYQPRRCRLVVLLDIPARSQPYSPQNSWGSQTADQEVRPDGFRQPMSGASPSSESSASQDPPGALPQLPHSFNPMFPTDSGPLAAGMLQEGLGSARVEADGSGDSDAATRSASTRMAEGSTNPAVISSAADVIDCNHPQPEQHSHHHRPALDNSLQPPTSSQSAVTSLPAATSPAQLVTYSAPDQAANSIQSGGLKDHELTGSEAAEAIDTAAQQAASCTLPEPRFGAGHEGSIQTQPARKEQNLHCLNAHPHEHQNIAQESPGTVRAAA